MTATKVQILLSPPHVLQGRCEREMGAILLQAVPLSAVWGNKKLSENGLLKQ